MSVEQALVMEIRPQVGVRPGPAPVLVSFLPDHLLFLDAPEPVQVTLPPRPFQVASAQIEALEYQPG